MISRRFVPFDNSFFHNWMQLTNVGDAFNDSKELKESYRDFGAYAIALQDKFATYPNTLKAKLAEIAAKTNVKFLNSKISKVSWIVRKLPEKVFDTLSPSLCPFSD